MRTLGALVALACSVALAESPRPAPKPRPLSAISVGAFLSMTGPTASFGVSTHQGIQLALEEHNARPNVRRLQLQVLDTAGKATDAEAAVTRLADQGVVAVIGEVSSSLSLAGGAVAQKRGLPMLVPSATHPDVTKLGDMITRLCVLDDAQAYAAAKFATGKLKLSRLAMLVDQSQAYASGLGQAFERELEKLGGTVVTSQTYTGGNNDFRTQLKAIATSKAQAIYIPGYYTDVGEIARQARAAGIKLPLLGADGWDSEHLRKLAGSAIEGSYFTNHFAATEMRPTVSKFVAAFRAKFNHDPDALAALGYDAANVLASAIGRARSHKGADLAAAIRATTDHDGVTGKLAIDPTTGEVRKPVLVVQVGPTDNVVVDIIPPR